MRRPRAGDERSSQALGRRRGSARWPIRAACQELADGAAVEACPQSLPERPSEMTAIPVKARRQPRIGKPPIKTVPGKRGPAQEFRFRHCDERKKTTANEPEQRKPVRVARQEALPHPREGMRILNDDGSATWRAIPSYPEGRRKTGLPGASIKNTGDGAWAWRLVFAAPLNRGQARTGNTCDSLATVLEHLSHTLRWHQRRRDSAIPFNDIGGRKGRVSLT